MEGDAGTGRLNVTDAGGPPASREERSDSGNETDASVQPEVLLDGESDAASDDAAEFDAAEFDAAEFDDAEDGVVPSAATGDVAVRRSERLGRGWLVGICALLLALTAGVAVGGYFALRSHDQSAAIAVEDAAALQRAKECVSATQAPDVGALTASQSKIIECSTGDFGVQANFFTGMLVEAYQAANVAVQVSDLRGAVEKHNDDGSVDVLVAVRVKVTNSQTADQEQGYRLRVNMAPADGTYKINRLDQVTS